MNNSNNNNNKKQLRVVFIHLDWGIGGAEQLMLQLCHATANCMQQKQEQEQQQQQQQQQQEQQSVLDLHLVTSYCNPDHCFEYLHPKRGIYYKYLNIWGTLIPTHLIGNTKGKAIMSTIRLLYLAYCIIHHSKMYKADIIVLDVLSTPLFLLRYLCHYNTNFIFYCHYPDQLLIQQQSSQSQRPSTNTSIKRYIQKVYRSILNYMEEQSMILADMIVVNSKFTQQVVYTTFPSLLLKSQKQQSKQAENQEGNGNIDTYTDCCPILYPALEIPSSNNNEVYEKRSNLIVSLNRYERKKNLSLLIEAIAYIRNNHKQLQNEATMKDSSNNTVIDIDDIHVIIAGGYDPKNVENIEYHIELQEMVKKLHIPNITFQFSISDIERTRLLHIATMVIYTPSHEHFGIVPLEAMYAQTPVIACNTGGPIETIVHGSTGYLCDSTSQSFGIAIYDLLSNPKKANEMGQKGHDHVLQHFSPNQLQKKWEQLLYRTIENGNERRNNTPYWYRIMIQYIITPRTILLGIESIVLLLLVYYCCIYLYYMIKYLLLFFPNHTEQQEL